MDQKTSDLIDELYCKLSPLLFRFAIFMLGDISIAEEAIQETFIIACINAKKLKASPNPEGWIVNTHKNVCLNIQKSRNRYLQKMFSLDDADHLLPYTEPAFEGNDDLSKYVSSEDFLILRKLILEGYSHKDLAEELNISIDACKKKFQRAKQRFRKNFQQ